jgi:O-antigen ligase
MEHILAFVGWAAPNAHNGYLEVWLGLGLVGLVLTMWFLIVAWWRAWRWLMTAPQSSAAVFAFLALSLYFARNFSESDLLDPVGLSWVVALFAALLPGIRQPAVSRQPRPQIGDALERERA